MKKIKIVIWSGGMDSTLLIYDFAKRGYNVWAYSFENIVFNQRKMENESQARKRFLQFAKSEGLIIHHRHIKVRSEVGIGSKGYAFPGISLCTVMPYFVNRCDVVFGFVRGDCFWRCSKDFIRAFYSMSRVFEYKNIRLLFPWKGFNKKQLGRRFIKSGIPEDCIWVCEMPEKRGDDFVKCGKCLPCRRNPLK